MKRNSFSVFFKYNENNRGRPPVFIVAGLVILLLLAIPVFGQEVSELSLTSPVFDEMSMIPERYTCDGVNVSPELNWEGVPEGCVTLALVVDDPDAPGKTWVHWVMWNIDPALGGLAEGVSVEEIGAIGGKNDFGKYVYGGPCPPSGTHRYRFTLYALSAYPDLKEGSTKGRLVRAIKDITIDTFTLTGRYRR
jgi:Raf kinase inhibitor-like YbhB/YbcL family protein